MKVVIAGMAYEYDGSKAPMSEALAIEHVYKRRYAEWQSDLAAGSARAMCVLAWIILRRDGTERAVRGHHRRQVRLRPDGDAEVDGRVGGGGGGGRGGPYRAVGPGWHTFDRHRYVAIFAREFQSARGKSS